MPRVVGGTEQGALFRAGLSGECGKLSVVDPGSPAALHHRLISDALRRWESACTVFLLLVVGAILWGFGLLGLKTPLGILRICERFGV